ncbi:hypothetical protein [Aliarcobacter butzleri]|uniref:hypothetical protein n=1 Tax=Aliarcobacter butzleri TaxID=28197 RepID=UPI00263F4509|nr:hypothetical protein [Aliarcobacter butzleri]MDN5094335.1 hypothetical protein [Aliarcobacter butzleri]
MDRQSLVDKKELLITWLNNADKEKVYDGLEEIEKLTGITPKTITRHKVLRNMLDEYSIKMKKQYIVKKKELLITWCKTADKEKVYSSLEEIENLSGLSAASLKNSNIKSILKQFGIKLFVQTLNQKKEILANWCKNADNKIIYNNTYEIENLVGLNKSSLYNKKLKQILYDYDIKIAHDLKQSLEEKKLLLTTWCNSIDKSKLYQSISEIEKYSGISLGSIHAYPELKNILDNYNIRMKIQSIEEKKEILIEWSKNADKNIGYTIQDVEKQSGLYSRSIGAYIELRQILEKYNIKLIGGQSLSDKTKILTEWCEKYAGNEKIYSGLKEIEKLSGLSSGSFKDKKLIPILQKFGIKIKSDILNIKISKKINIVIFTCINKNIKLTCLEALSEYANDILNIKISIPEDIDFCNFIINTYQIFTDKDNSILTDYIKSILAILSTDKIAIDKISLTEIKYHLLEINKIYITERILISVLQSLDMNYNMILEDNIDKRFRLAYILYETGSIKIDYRETLPLINTNSDGSIIILKSIQNIDSFLKLWKEYIKYLINNKLFGLELNNDIEYDNIEFIINGESQYSDIFFLSKKSLKHLHKLSYEGLAAFAFTVMNISKNNNSYSTLSKKYDFMKDICSCFFLWLSKNGLAISHPKYLNVNHDSLIINIIDSLMKDHIINEIFNDSIKSNKLSFKDKELITNNDSKKHLIYLFSSISSSFKPLKLIRNDFEDYLDCTFPYINDNNITHQAFIEILFTSLGNKMALLSKEYQSAIEYHRDKLLGLKLSVNTYKNYSQLMKDIEEIILFRSEHENVGIHTCKSITKTFMFLLKFLNNIDYRLSRKELINALNPFTNTENDFKSFLILNASEHAYYNVVGMNLVLLFDQTKDNEYNGIYSKKWCVIPKKEKIRKLIRSPYSEAIYETLQNVAFNMPAEYTNYTYLKNGKNKSILDTSWWKHDYVSPVIAVALWLITKLPRRGAHILNLDVNTFLQYNEVIIEDGSVSKVLSGFYFNTDKNQDFAKYCRDIIKIELLVRIFKPDELKLIENYVKYIKDAYFFMPKIKYRSKPGYEPIQPLFPNSEGNGILKKTHLDAYFNKTLLITQFKVRELAKNGFFDNKFNDLERKKEIEDLSEITLLFPRDNKSNIQKLPNNLEEMKNFKCKETNYLKFYTSKNGLHNLRHTGATYLLLTVGMSLEDITFVTSHTDERVLKDVYLAVSKRDIFLYTNKTMNDIGLIVDEISGFNNDYSMKLGTSFINTILIPRIKNSDQCSDIILKTLNNNGFMSSSYHIVSNDSTLYGTTGQIFVDNGLEIASWFNPIGNWEVRPYGICTMKNGCPEGTAGVCSKCPHLIYNIFNIEGVIFKTNETMLELAQIQSLLLEATKSGTNSDRKELRDLHNKTFEAYLGWLKILESIEIKISSLHKKDKNMPVVSNTIASKLSCIKELQMDILYQANELGIKNLTTEKAKSNITNYLFKKLIKNGNIKTAERIALEGVDWFIEGYSKSSQNDKRDIVKFYLSDNEVYNDNKQLNNISSFLNTN